MKFVDLRLIEPILRALVTEGYVTATPIQAKEGEAKSPTGVRPGSNVPVEGKRLGPREDRRPLLLLPPRPFQREALARVLTEVFAPAVLAAVLPLIIGLHAAESPVSMSPHRVKYEQR